MKIRENRIKPPVIIMTWLGLLFPHMKKGSFVDYHKCLGIRAEIAPMNARMTADPRPRRMI
jgi:hypothetical protein